MSLVGTDLPSHLMFLLLFCNFKFLPHMYCYKYSSSSHPELNPYKWNIHFPLSTNPELPLSLLPIFSSVFLFDLWIYAHLLLWYFKSIMLVCHPRPWQGPLPDIMCCLEFNGHVPTNTWTHVLVSSLLHNEWLKYFSSCFYELNVPKCNEYPVN